jgi:hypothetical protein
MGSDDVRLERIADTEGNERLANEVIVKARRDGTPFKVRCECGDPTCHEPLVLTQELYERVRSDSMLFVVLPGHEFPEAEDVVEKDEGYEIVRKHENMRAVVERSDPRT